MDKHPPKHIPIDELIEGYERHLSVRGLARNTRSLHRHVVRELLHYRFPNGQIAWGEFHFCDCAAFLKEELARLSKRGTKRSWLMVVRSVLRYWAAQGYIPGGWDAALPRVPFYRQASLPRNLSEKQLADLKGACRENKRQHFRYRALLLLFWRLGLRTGEVANLHLQDVDWRNGCLRIRGTKSHRERLLPLPGYAIIARLIDKATSQTSKWRTRDYKPALRAWGKPEEWYEGEADAIQPRGEKPYLGPVAALIGPRTFSAAEDFVVPLKATKRATLIGTPTAGSTGQPLFMRVFGVSAMICTKWDRFPDGTEFVGIGIQPDILVQRTRRDVAEGWDPDLERAVALLQSAK